MDVLVKNRFDIKKKRNLRARFPAMLQQTSNKDKRDKLPSLCWEQYRSIQSQRSSNFLPMRLPTEHVTAGSVPAVQLWHQSGAPRPCCNLPSLCQDLTPVTLFLLLVFDLMLFALDSSASRANGKSGWNTKRGNVLQLFLVLMKHIGLSGLLF